MKTLEDIQERWRRTQPYTASLDELQRAVKHTGPASPCVSGLRSVCWKAFLLSQSQQDTDWPLLLRQSRQDYTQQSDAYLKYVRHPEGLATLAVDPLADEPNSPWNIARQDEVVRAEIQQDVQRLPDDANYHDEHIQTMILDVLFVYCKTNPTRGGYRQGMHELLAPIIHVLESDAVNRSTLDAPQLQDLDQTMLDILDYSFIEHDAFLLFSSLMENAQSFYEINSPAKAPSEHPPLRQQEQTSSIVERSKFIHEVCLAKVDPELAVHLTSIEVLPQIFLIRWIRLLFSREFPFEKFLVLWDTIFAVDPTLELIDLICVAMLIRIRWQVLEADYTVCLQLLLKYPAPDKAHGPDTFVEDAVYLRGHLNVSGGSALINKYTGRMPSTVKPAEDSRPTTPSFKSFTSIRNRSLGGAKSPLNSSARFMQQQGGASVEALFQNAAKGARGVFERGEKLGINQAVRDAVGEIRRGFNEARSTTGLPRTPREILKYEGGATAVAAMEKRNRQLGSMLEETIESLKSLAEAKLEDRQKSLEQVEIAAAKVQFVKIYLDDPTMEVPELNSPTTEDVPKELNDSPPAPDVKAKGAKPPPRTELPKPGQLPISTLSLAEDKTGDKGGSSQSQNMSTSTHPSGSNAMDNVSGGPQSDPLQVGIAPLAKRPSAPTPTRSTLAQSSFSWMLEPDESAQSSSRPPSASKSPPSAAHKKRPNNASRERNAFLFGEIPQESEGKDGPKDDIFGLEPLQKAKSP